MTILIYSLFFSSIFFSFIHLRRFFFSGAQVFFGVKVATPVDFKSEKPRENKQGITQSSFWEE